MSHFQKVLFDNVIINKDDIRIVIFGDRENSILIEWVNNKNIERNYKTSEEYLKAKEELISKLV